MFIRYVGSGYGGSGRGIGKGSDRKFPKLRLIRFAIVVLVFMLGYMLYTSDMMASLRDVSIKKWAYNMVLSVHEHMVKANYNISDYSEWNDNISRYMERDDADAPIWAAINSQSNLYEYVSESGGVVGIKYDPTDPGYDVAEIQMPDGEEPESEIAPDTQVEQPTQVVSTDEGIDGYVVPAVATSGVTYTLEQLSDFDFLMSKLYTVPARALVRESDLVAKDMLAKDMTMKNDNSKPQILIYHTHSQEGFVDSVAGDESTTIVAVGAYLAKILSEEYGYNVIHCKEYFDMAGGTLDRSKAYTYAQGTIEQILEDNPSIEVLLDIHRDGLPDGADKLVTNIGGKDVAKIMLFNGVSRSSAAGDIDYLYNRYRADNLAFSFQLKLQAMECYPEFTRRNYIDAYQYNLHHRPKSVLVEVGAQNNTLQEELNAMEVFAEVLHRVLTPES